GAGGPQRAVGPPLAPCASGPATCCAGRAVQSLAAAEASSTASKPRATRLGRVTYAPPALAWIGTAVLPPAAKFTGTVSVGSAMPESTATIALPERLTASTMP